MDDRTTFHFPLDTSEHDGGQHPPASSDLHADTDPLTNESRELARGLRPPVASGGVHLSTVQDQAVLQRRRRIIRRRNGR
jgi:hypothetical protein